MGWVGKYFEGKWLIRTLWNYIRTKWLEEEYKRSNWWRTYEMITEWSRIIRLSVYAIKVQQNRTTCGLVTYTDGN